MKRILIPTLLALSFLISAHSNAEPVTPIQLKVMQTRVFKKPPLEVMLAIKTFCEDNGATNVIGKRPEFNQNMEPVPTSGVISCLFPPKITYSVFGGVKNENKIGVIKGEAIKFDKESITIRMRIMTSFPNQEQITDPEEYSRFFKAIGDTVFTEAIELEPAEQL